MIFISRVLFFVFLAGALSVSARQVSAQDHDENFLDIAKLQSEVNCADVPKILEIAISWEEQRKSGYAGYNSQDLMTKYPCEKYESNEEYKRLERYLDNIEWRVDRFAECIGSMDDDKYVDLYIDFIRSYEPHAIETYTFSFAILYTLKANYIDKYIISAGEKEREFLLDTLWWGLKNMAYEEDEENVYTKLLQHAKAMFHEKWAERERKYQEWLQEHGLKE
jgi:hypothetical protein